MKMLNFANCRIKFLALRFKVSFCNIKSTIFVESLHFSLQFKIYHYGNSLFQTVLTENFLSGLIVADNNIFSQLRYFQGRKCLWKSVFVVLNLITKVYSRIMLSVNRKSLFSQNAKIWQFSLTEKTFFYKHFLS